MNRCPHPSPSAMHPRRGDTAKTVIIVLATLFGVFVVTCAGVGVLGYFWVQKNFGQMALTKPEDIQKLTAEMTDITFPPEFHPVHGTSVFGMKIVSYRWCPAGNCPPLIADETTDGESGVMTLTSFTTGESGAPTGIDPDEQLEDLMLDDDSLKDQYITFTKEVREFTVRGKACKFYFVRGEEQDWSATDAVDKTMQDEPAEAVEPAAPATDPAATTEPAATDPAVATEAPVTPAAPVKTPKGTGIVIVTVQGTFPGKTADVSLNFRIPADQYQEEKVLGVLQSIK